HLVKNGNYTAYVIKMLLRNPILIGRTERFGITWRIVEPLVSMEDWEALQRNIDRKKHFNYATHGAPAHHILTGLYKCVCGSAMVLQPRSTYPRLICLKQHRERDYKVMSEGIRNHWTIDGNKAEQFVNDLVEVGHHAIMHILRSDSSDIDREVKSANDD